MNFRDLRESYKFGVVILGDFNPVIFQPKWLMSKGLIGESEGKEADVDIIHPSVSRFKLSWADFEVTHERFSISTMNEGMFNAVVDIVVSIFSYFNDIPVKAIGINHSMLFDLRGEGDLHYELGNKLAPLKNWNEILEDPGVLKIEILEPKRNDHYDGRYTIGVSSSLKLKKGVNIDINDHINLDENSNVGAIVEERRDGSIERAEKSVEHIFQLLENE